jgi:hypothetical protein
MMQLAEGYKLVLGAQSSQNNIRPTTDYKQRTTNKASMARCLKSSQMTNRYDFE